MSRNENKRGKKKKVILNDKCVWIEYQSSEVPFLGLIINTVNGSILRYEELYLCFVVAI